MTSERLFKRRVRERMSKTGESYAAARSHVSQKRDRVPRPDEARGDRGAPVR